MWGKLQKLQENAVYPVMLCHIMYVYIYIIYIYIYIYIVPILVQASVDNVPWRLSLDAQYVLAVVMRC
jgi:uncharacterized membrane protein